MNTKLMFSSQKQDWKTPTELFNKLDEEFGFDCDPCPAQNYMEGVSMNGLVHTWGNVNFVNPPYNEVGLWVKKAYEEWQKGKSSVLLIPSRTDTKWFHDYVLDKAKIRFIKGRLKFQGAKNPAPFASMIVIYQKETGA